MFKLKSFEGNPIVKPQDLGLIWENEKGEKCIGAVFNPGATIFDNKIILLPRVNKNYKRIKFYDEKLKMERWGMENYFSEIYPLESEDGINFKRIDDVRVPKETKDFKYGIEDIRITPYKDEFILIGCGKIKPPFKGGDADRVAIYRTKDFKSFEYCGIIKEFDSRNAVLFFVDGKPYMFLRFHPNIHLIELPDIEVVFEPEKNSNFWKKVVENKYKSLFMEAGKYPHQREKIGAGTNLIETTEGFIFIYHAVGFISKEITRNYGLNFDIERGYSVNVALLDKENPKKIISSLDYPIYIPNNPWELGGNDEYPIDIPNVVFPVGAVEREGKILIYAGACDKYVILLETEKEVLIEELLKNKK